jgi:hypothetical protein
VVRLDAHRLVQQQIAPVLAQLTVSRDITGQEQDGFQAGDPAGRRELHPRVREVRALGDHMRGAVCQRPAQDELAEACLAAADRPGPCQVLALHEQPDAVAAREAAQRMEGRRIQADVQTR